jgi:arylsulfatase A-like enzyme
VHAPFDPKPELLTKYRARPGVEDPAMAATMEAMDANIGRVLAALERLKVADRTHVIFTSDNGGARQTVAPLRAGKGSLYQGGIRVPAVARGPGIKPGASRTVALSMDWYPTVLELAGVQVPSGASIDGRSLVPLLNGKEDFASRDVFWHFPCYVGGGEPSSAVRSGDFKLIEFFEKKTWELYDLASDPGEKTNLASIDPERAKELLAKLHAWQKCMGAPRPEQHNPRYNPGSEPKRERGEKRSQGNSPKIKSER